MMGRRHRAIGLLVLAASISSCSPSGTADPRTELVLWRNQVGLQEEAATAALVARFNTAQSRWHVVAQSLPQGGYGQSVVAASLAGRMPCIMTVDSPTVASYAWAGHLRPLNDYVSAEVIAKISPAAVGRYAGKVYALGQIDAALAIYTKRSILSAVDARIPTLDHPWTAAEFEKVLDGLKAGGRYRYPLDLATRDDKPSWWTYSFSPILQSFGGDLIDRTAMTSAQGVLNGEPAVRFGGWFQNLFRKGLVNRKEPDENGFVKGRSALIYTGSWWAADYRSYAGADLLILPPPDFGHGVRIGGGSWQWAISHTCAHPDGAGEFIRFLLRPENIAAMSDASGGVPVTEAGAAASKAFGKGGESRVFFELMRRFAVERPATPAFPTIANAFTAGMRDIMDGGDVRDSLDDAVDDIDSAIADNPGSAKMRK